jgi:hypothetical protein
MYGGFRRALPGSEGNSRDPPSFASTFIRFRRDKEENIEP